MWWKRRAIGGGRSLKVSILVENNGEKRDTEADQDETVTNKHMKYKIIVYVKNQNHYSNIHFIFLFLPSEKKVTISPIIDNSITFMLTPAKEKLNH